jgi:CHAT domain-containing protein
VRDNLDENEAMLEYTIANNQIYIFCSTHEETVISKIIAGEDFMGHYRDFLKNIKTGTQWTTSKLSELLLGPVYKYLKDKDHITIIPDNELFNIPFEALNIPGQERPLINAHSVVYNYSARLWLESKNNAGFEPAYDLVSYAPEFRSSGDAQISLRNDFRGEDLDNYSEMFAGGSHDLLAPLPYAVEETEIIGAIYREQNKRIKQFSGDKATEQQFHSTPPAGILHIATHGFSSKVAPEQSGLFFAADKNEHAPQGCTNDGILYINELFTLHLQANLVVLSACKSGTGNVMEGEGIYALPRGFIYAGIPHLIASMWKVHDEKTMQLITTFYQQIAQGKSYKQALQFSKINMFEKGELPMDWSGLILIGH